MRRSSADVQLVCPDPHGLCGGGQRRSSSPCSCFTRCCGWLGVGRETATGYALILPWIIGFLVWNLGPFIASLYLSFTDYTILSPPTWIGFDNYVEMFTDDRNFWKVLRFTLGYSLINVPLGLVGALITATLLNQDVRGLGLWRTLYYLPAVLPAAATALLWRWMLASDGLVNFFFGPLYDLCGDGEAALADRSGHGAARPTS